MSRSATTGRWQLGLVLALGAALMWGLLPIGLKKLLQFLDPWTVTWFRFALSAVILAPFVLPRGLPRPGGAGRVVLVAGAVAVAGLLSNYIVYVLGLEHLTPSAAQVVIQSAPLFLLLGSILFFHERFTPVQWTGCGVFVLGLGLFFHRELEEIFLRFGEMSLGVALVVLAGLLWAIYGLAQKKLLDAFSSAQVLLVIYLSGGLFFLPMARPGHVLDLDGLGLGLLAFAVLNTLLAYGCFAEALRHWEASRVSASLTVVPLITVSVMAVLPGLWPNFLPTEDLTLPALAGAGLVVTGSMMAALAGKRRESEDWRPESGGETTP